MFSDQNSLQEIRPNHRNLPFSMYYPMNPHMYTTAYNTGVQQDLIYPAALTHNNTDNDMRSVVTLEKRHSDETYINNFLLDIKQSNNTNGQKNEKRASKIAMAKNALVSTFKLNEKLQIICTELENNQDLTDEEWQEKMIQCSTVKHEITQLLEPFRDVNFMSQLKKDLEKRKKKRLREKHKRENWKNDKQLRIERRARLHAEIDSWIRREQAVIEKEKQEENLRKDADMILSDVRGKRSDARKYLGLLQELQNLRNVKVNIARARGEHLSSAADETFNNLIGKLKEQWSNLDREYCIEEQGLKLMLKTDNETRIERQKKNIFNDWEITLFGKKVLSIDQFRMDLNTFVTMRTAWDRYISSNGDASTIPIGWVIPDKPSSAAWEKCLRNDVS